VTAFAIARTSGWGGRAVVREQPVTRRQRNALALAGIAGVANAEEQFEHLERALSSAGLTIEEAASLIAELLQLQVGERYPALSWTPEQKRRRLLAALADG
jgi:hypothetical protein